MSVTIKTAREIELMREAGKILASVHERLAEMIVPGISTLEIDKKAYEIIRSHNCSPSFLNYNGFPASVCISLNDEVVHGIPSETRLIREGDIVSLDAGVIYQGYHSDAARTISVGKTAENAVKLIEVTKQSFFEGMKFAKAGNHLHEISAAIEDYVVSHGFSCVRELVGHGIGAALHEEPQIPNFRQTRRGIKLTKGMTLAIEPMVNFGNANVCILDDDWTVVTEDGSLSAHYENTILITENEPEILSL
jgi:methionyl aminopeptidase